MPTPALLFAGILFGAIGFGAFVYGKRQAELAVMLAGLGLMILPYVVGDAPGLYASGAAICALIYWLRR